MEERRKGKSWRMGRRGESRGRRRDTNLPRCVTRLPTTFAAIVGHPPVLARVSHQCDLLLYFSANLVPKVWAAAIKNADADDANWWHFDADDAN